MSDQPNYCEFCDIDGFGLHAPRCPVTLEARIAELEVALSLHPSPFPAHYAAVQKECRELGDRLHYANGVADLAMKHRDEAEAKLDEIKRIVGFPESTQGESSTPIEQLSD